MAFPYAKKADRYEHHFTLSTENSTFNLTQNYHLWTSQCKIKLSTNLSNSFLALQMSKMSIKMKAYITCDCDGTMLEDLIALEIQLGINH